MIPLNRSEMITYNKKIQMEELTISAGKVIYKFLTIINNRFYEKNSIPKNG